MTTLYEGAFAKLNLTLDVLGKREDGYHDLQSVMQTISVRDDIEIDIGTGRPWCLKCDKEGIPCDEKNLAWKAAKVYFDAMKKDPDGIEIRITKRIPSEAGMGGGSADAAAVLRALNRHYGEPLSIGALAELGAQVGSDVPFCVVCGTAMVEGRGEKLRKLPDMPDCIFVICKPDFSVSTPELYKKIDQCTIGKRPDNRAMDPVCICISAFANPFCSGRQLNICNIFSHVDRTEDFSVTVELEHITFEFIPHHFSLIKDRFVQSECSEFADQLFPFRRSFCPVDHELTRERINAVARRIAIFHTIVKERNAIHHEVQKQQSFRGFRWHLRFQSMIHIIICNIMIIKETREFCIAAPSGNELRRFFGSQCKISCESAPGTMIVQDSASISRRACSRRV